MKSVILTGCSRGIGRAILERLILDGNYKIYAITKNADRLESIKNDNLTIYSCDLTDLKSVENIIQEILKKADKINVLINNAGIGLFKKVEDLEVTDWDKVLTLNLIVPFFMVKYILPGMKLQNSGRIINISSDADSVGFSEGSLYCASKFGLRGFSDSIRLELKGSNISITTISPGRVDTYFNGKKPGDRPYSLSADDVASQVMHVLNQSDRCEIEKIYIKSTLE